MSGLRLELRLWNLWDAGNPHAITWSVDSVKLVAIRPEEVMVPFGEKVSLEVGNLNRDVAPGGVLQTTAPITVGQYATLAWSSYSALLVTAHLANSERTPLKFTVPIPNGFPLVRQEAAIDQTSLYTAPAEDCCTTCTRCGENQAFRNPLTQEATGTIEVFPVKKDIFMKPATPEVEAAARRDARVSAVALLAFPEPNATFTNPTRPANGAGTSLVLSGSNLQRIDDGLWMRPVDAPDVPDQAPLSFTVTLNPRTFFVSTGSPEDDGARATGTVYLAVWMSSGAAPRSCGASWTSRRGPSTAGSITSRRCRSGRATTARSTRSTAPSCRASIGSAIASTPTAPTERPFPTRWSCITRSIACRSVCTSTCSIASRATYGGTLLDDSAACWTNDLGDEPPHDASNTPWIIAGSAGGTLRTGQVVDHQKKNINLVLNTLINAMGIRKIDGSPTDDFGDATLTRGVVTNSLSS